MAEILKSKRESKKIISRAKHVKKKDTSIRRRKPKKYLAEIKTAKNIRLIEKRRLINRARKSKMKTSVKNLVIVINNNQQDQMQEAFKHAQSQIMKLSGKNIIKKNKASRMISKLNAKVKQSVQAAAAANA
jgi:small subunit ribosomal protein S20